MPSGAYFYCSVVGHLKASCPQLSKWYVFDISHRDNSDVLFPAGSLSGKVPQQDHPVEPSVDLKVKEVNTLSKLVSNLKSVRALVK